MRGYDHWKTTEPESYASIEDEMQALRNQLTYERGELAKADALIVACCPLPSENSPHAHTYHAAEKRHRQRTGSR
jgi:hypothetical protein